MGFWDFVTGSTPAGVISETSQKVLGGVFEGVNSLIEQFHLSPEDAQKFKIAMAQMELESYKTQISDIQSARQMQMANRSSWPGIITFTMLVGFFGVMILIILNDLPKLNEAGGQAIMLMIGALTTGLGTAIHFWLGANKDDQTKAEMLARSIPVSQATVVTPPK